METVLIQSDPGYMARRSSYEISGDADDIVLRIVAEFVSRQLKRLSPKRVLDVGCGNQPFRSAVQSLGVVKYVSGDRQQNDLGNVDYLFPVDGTIPSGLAAEGKFDCVMLTEVLEHVPDWESTFRNLKQVTETGSYVLITCPAIFRLHEEPWDYWRPTPHTFEYFSNKWGFEVETFEKGGSAWDAMGLVMARSQILARPGIWAVLQRKFISAVKRLFLRWAKDGTLNRLAPVESPFYVHNLVVLRRI